MVTTHLRGLGQLRNDSLDASLAVGSGKGRVACRAGRSGEQRKGKLRAPKSIIQCMFPWRAGSTKPADCSLQGFRSILIAWSCALKQGR